jgi:hypothetical protein
MKKQLSWIKNQLSYAELANLMNFSVQFLKGVVLKENK